MRLLDPRGRLTLRRIALAPRPGLAALRDGPVLFYDNLKMDVGHYGALLPRVKKCLERHGINSFIGHRETIRGKSAEGIAALACKLAAMRPAAAVIALADMGVSPAMVALTVALEEAGVPTVCITAPPGSALANAHAHYRAGALCLVEADIVPASDAAVVEREADAAAERIVSMLTSQSAVEIDYPVDRESAAADGFLDVRPSTSLPLRSGRTDTLEHPAVRPERRREAPKSKDEVEARTDTAVRAERSGSEVDARTDTAVRAERSGSEVEARTDDQAVFECFEALHIGDGMPITAPTVERYDRMREYCPFDPDEIIVSGVGPSGTPVTVREILIAAIMAGCRPEYVPIVLTAIRALARPGYGLLQAVTTSFSGGHFVLASGPIAREIGMHGGQGCLGPGFRANATIGRAVNLTLLNVCRPVPGHADLACLSSPAERSYCMAEDPTLSPWPAMNEERFDADTTCVMVLKAEAPHNVLDIGSPSGAALMEIIVDCCTTLGSNNASVAGPLVLVLTPDHADLLARDGYDKPRLRREIHASARIPHDRLAAHRIVGVESDAGAAGFHHVTRSPDDVQIVVAGGKGGHSAVILPWGLYSEAVFEVVRLSDGRAGMCLAEFRVEPGSDPKEAGV